MAVEIQFPQFYRGVYARTQSKYGPLIREAIERMEAVENASSDLRPFLAYQTWQNPQPSFVLFPFMFLATAEASGGVTDRHRDYLPTIMLAAELCAVADDTIDRAPLRSGRETFAARFGDTSAVPMASALSTMVLRDSRHDERLFEAASGFFMAFFGLELWECAHTYPDPKLFPTWLVHRYDQAIVATEYVLNAALILNGRPLWAREAVAAFSRIGQDVDDIVNVLEYRELEGENDDLQAGVVTRPLVLAVEKVPKLGPKVAALWRKYRLLATKQLPIGELARKRSRLNATLMSEYAEARELIIEHGVPGAIQECRTELQVAVRASPPELRPLMRELANAFLDRLKRCKRVSLGSKLGVAV